MFFLHPHVYEWKSIGTSFLLKFKMFFQVSYLVQSYIIIISFYYHLFFTAIDDTRIIFNVSSSLYSFFFCFYCYVQFFFSFSHNVQSRTWTLLLLKNKGARRYRIVVKRIFSFSNSEGEKNVINWISIYPPNFSPTLYAYIRRAVFFFSNITNQKRLFF